MRPVPFDTFARLTTGEAGRMDKSPRKGLGNIKGYYVSCTLLRRLSDESRNQPLLDTV